MHIPVIALNNSKLKYDHVFSFDNDKCSKQFTSTNFKSNMFFDEMGDRSLYSLPDIDL